MKTTLAAQMTCGKRRTEQAQQRTNLPNLDQSRPVVLQGADVTSEETRRVKATQSTVAQQ
jgi:hypothetical protein